MKSQNCMHFKTNFVLNHWLTKTDEERGASFAYSRFGILVVTISNTMYVCFEDWSMQENMI